MRERKCVRKGEERSRRKRGGEEGGAKWGNK